MVQLLQFLSTKDEGIKVQRSSVTCLKSQSVTIIIFLNILLYALRRSNRKRNNGVSCFTDAVKE